MGQKQSATSIRIGKNSLDCTVVDLQSDFVGNRVVYLTSDACMVVWFRETNQKAEYRFDECLPKFLKISPNGKFVLAGSVYLISDPPQGEKLECVLRIAEIDESFVHHLTPSFDSSRVYLTTSYGTLSSRMLADWSISGDRFPPVLQIDAELECITRTVLSPDGSRLAVAFSVWRRMKSRIGRVVITEIESGYTYELNLGTRPPIERLEFSGDGAFVLITHVGSSAVVLYRTASGEVVTVMPRLRLLRLSFDGMHYVGIEGPEKPVWARPRSEPTTAEPTGPLCLRLARIDPQATGAQRDQHEVLFTAVVRSLACDLSANGEYLFYDDAKTGLIARRVGVGMIGRAPLRWRSTFEEDMIKLSYVERAVL